MITPQEGYDAEDLKTLDGALVIKDEDIPNIVANSHTAEWVEENAIKFFTPTEEIIKLCDNGDIFVHGKLVENDKEVVEGMREFLRLNGLYK